MKFKLFIATLALALGVSTANADNPTNFVECEAAG